MLRFLPLAIAALTLAGSIALAHPPHRHAQPKAKAAPGAQTRAPAPGGPRNLKVFPQDIPQERLMLVMRSWSQALGVQCSHCHVPNDPASDANPHKDAARGMMKMTQRINHELLPEVTGLHGGAVTCYTCHRGTPSPAPVAPDEWPGPGSRPAQTPPRHPHPPNEPPPAHIAPDTPARPY